MSNWISVNERLPNKDQLIAFVNNGLVYIGRYEDVCGVLVFTFNLYQDDYWGKGANPMTARKVTHWMPLPEPPAKEE